MKGIIALQNIFCPMTVDIFSYKVIMLDFDGVILESVYVKTEAFRKLFSGKRKFSDEIVNFHLKNGGMSRYDKFRHIYSEILHEELTDATFSTLCNLFAKYVYEGVINSPFVNGVPEFIDKCNKNQIPIYVVSATPQDEILQITKEIGIYDKFNHVYGSPMKKSECIAQILKENNLTQYPKTALFFGDAINDYKAAKETNVSFVGRVPHGSCNVFEGLDGVMEVIPDFTNFSD